ncbi:C4-type zinc ribbon domain-containing protein [Tessaracoccus sp. OS52]|uniref:zinc ribbon domain-containing protein n=1 Tax=Tessaracoccus sp. OS52 TaxID=2886691 RepID=UPI001D10637D|nr:C4-type zinc ribbon domain-containing protein [Tessaracoccus sp. OS52]MCC2593484.1 C4-type zinc ribbon domain-containing protein [Tessaracoccus sp. OS52]
MQAEPADQQRLLQLADLDQELGRVQHTAKSLPEHKQINELMAARQQVTDALVSVTTEVDDLQVGVRRAENDLVPVKARLERDSRRIEDGSVTDSKTLRGLIDEVEHIKRRIGTLEDEQLEVMGQLEAAEARQAEITARKAEIEAKLRELVAARNEKVTALQAEAGELGTSRAAVAAQVAPDLLKLYERIREQRGLGAARLARGRCTGCQLEITVSDLDDYRRAPANQVLRCVECDRILVRTPESGL